MKAIPFDTLAEAMAELINDNLPTKRDLQEMEYRLLLKIGAMMAASVGLITALVKLL